MESVSALAFELRDSNSTSSSVKTNNSSSEKENNYVDESVTLDGVRIPTWKLPLTSALLQKASRITDIKSEPEKQSLKSKRDSMIPVQAAISPELAEDEATAQLIQILLPCIICNRTFSPEALERHSKVCSQVNIKDPRRPARGKFNSAEQRKKHTELEVYIPPPPDSDSSDGHNFVRKGSCRLYNHENPSGAFNRNSKTRATIGSTPSSNSMIPTWRRNRAKTPEKLRSPEPFENLSEFGSEDSHDSTSTRATQQQQRNLPSYAQPLSPTGTCPYCARNFNHKAYDRHVKFCQELYERKQYEIQPIPKEKEEAMERQEIRTKYKPLKSSTSCGSLRSSVSPGRDFPAMMAMKFYGFMNKTFNKNFKKSNESLTAASCYGDYRHASPAPSSIISVKTRPVYQRANTSITAPSRSLRAPAMKSNIPQRTKSIENMNLANSNNNHSNNSYGNNQYSHVPSSGYGQQQQHISNCPMNFNRNSKLRGSLHKNFYFNSSKRVGPEGTDATPTTNTVPTPTTTTSLNNSELIITPMSLYSKNKILTERQNKQQEQQPYTSEEYSQKPHGLLHSNDGSYDPYEKAARQFEELLKTQVKSENSPKSSHHHGRKVGLDRALRSVTEPFAPLPGNNGLSAAQSEPKKSRESKKDGGDESFVFNLADDGYWDQILNKRKEEVKLKVEEQQQQQQQQQEQQQEGNDKSRAVSNISSSVDSAFSRSDGADLEFEALESLVSTAREPTTGGNQAPSLPAIVPKAVENPRSSYSSPIISNYQPRNSGTPVEETAKTPASLPSLFNSGTNQPASNVTHLGNRENMSSDSGPPIPAALAAPTPAKFCHECGMLYPTATAKFCPECGERRVIK